MYSIHKRKCKCSEDCKLMPSISYAGYNRSHAPEKIKEVQDAKSQKQRTISNKRKLNKAKSLMNTDTNVEMALRQFDADLKEWFTYHMEYSKKRCENCGQSLEHYNKKAWHGSQHHIINKSEESGCPSVATELLNHGVLGYWCCHNQWHTSYMNAEKMKCFPLFKERFKLFKDKIADDERKKIPECFLIQL